VLYLSAYTTITIIVQCNATVSENSRVCKEAELAFNHALNLFSIITCFAFATKSTVCENSRVCKEAELASVTFDMADAEAVEALLTSYPGKTACTFYCAHLHIHKHTYFIVLFY
jgi:hypothetical protein